MSNRRSFDEMDSMMSRMFRNMWGDLGHNLGLDHDGEGRMDGGVHMRTERTEDGYVLLADLPGFEKEEIDLRYEDGVLTIEATHETSEGDEHHALSRSRSVFEQTRIPHADEIVVDGIEASYRNGVLEVHVPMAEMDDDVRQIDID